MNCRKKIENLGSGIVELESFEEHNKKEDESTAFSYDNRDVSQKPLEAELDRLLPFVSFPLL